MFPVHKYTCDTRLGTIAMFETTDERYKFSFWSRSRIAGDGDRGFWREKEYVFDCYVSIHADSVKCQDVSVMIDNGSHVHYEPYSNRTLQTQIACECDKILHREHMLDGATFKAGHIATKVRYRTAMSGVPTFYLTDDQLMEDHATHKEKRNYDRFKRLIKELESCETR
jgi:hypothetical protein